MNQNEHQQRAAGIQPAELTRLIGPAGKMPAAR